MHCIFLLKPLPCCSIQTVAAVHKSGLPRVTKSQKGMRPLTAFLSFTVSMAELAPRLPSAEGTSEPESTLSRLSPRPFH